MTYSSGGPGYPGAQPPGGYAPTTQLPKVDDGPSKLPLYLLAGVAILGLAAYLLSFGPAWKSTDASGSVVPILGIVAMLFAALFAVTALLPKQGNYTPVVTATSVVGFLLIIWDLIKGGQAAGWALIVIVVLSALQTVVAIAALLLDAGVITPPAPRPRYDPYQPYGGGYYAQPSFSGPAIGTRSRRMRTLPRASARLLATLRSSATRADRLQATSRRSRYRRNRYISPGRRRRPPASPRTRRRPVHRLLQSNNQPLRRRKGRPSWRRSSSSSRRRPALRRRRQALLALGPNADSGP